MSLCLDNTRPAIITYFVPVRYRVGLINKQTKQLLRAANFKGGKLLMNNTRRIYDYIKIHRSFLVEHENVVIKLNFSKSD